jgi:hypothetical protein
MFPMNREQYLTNIAKCDELHDVIDFMFEHHICEECVLREIIEQMAGSVRERRESRDDGLIRIAWREDNVRRAQLFEYERIFEQYLESQRPVEPLLDPGSEAGQP